MKKRPLLFQTDYKEENFKKTRLKNLIRNTLMILLCCVIMMIFVAPLYAGNISNTAKSWAQADSRWSGQSLGGSGYTMGSSGCAVTSVTKLAIQAGLKNEGSFTPLNMVQGLNSIGALPGGAIAWNQVGNIVPGMVCEGWGGFDSLTMQQRLDRLKSLASQGKNVVVAVNDYGHYVALDNELTIANGYPTIMDSSSITSNNINVNLYSRYPNINSCMIYSGGSQIYASVKNTEVKSITSNNAIVHGTVTKPSGANFTKSGVYVWQDGSSTKLSYFETLSNTYPNLTSVPVWYDLKNEAKFTINPGTKYWYQLYAVVGGKEYRSTATSFQTTGIKIPGDIYVGQFGKDVEVAWSSVAGAISYDVYLLQSPWGWADVKYSKNTTNTSHIFTNVTPGQYAAFVISRPNENSAQSKWVHFTVEDKSITSVKATAAIEYEGHEYSLYDNSLTWENAKRIAEALGGHLVTITSAGEQNAVYNMVKSNGKNLYYWLGAKENGSSGVYSWVTGEAFSYTNWQTGEPSGGKEHWLMMYRDRNGLWNDRISTLGDMGFIVEKAKNTPNPIDPAKPSNKFADIPGGIWYEGYVYDLANKNILNGKSEGKFDPQGKITRAEFAKILAYASGDDLAPYDKECVFGDSRNHWSKKNINWAYEHQIVKGKGGGFAPNANISRQEMAVMIKRYADYKGITLPKKVEAIVFNDAAKIASWAKAEVTAMQQATIIGGKPGNLFDPEGNALRCEAAKMISVFLGL